MRRALLFSIVVVLVAGVVAYLLTWAFAIAAWRRVLAGQAAAAVKRSRARTAAAPGTAE